MTPKLTLGERLAMLAAFSSALSKTNVAPVNLTNVLTPAMGEQ
jgi:hypothetical protein